MSGQTEKDKPKKKRNSKREPVKLTPKQENFAQLYIELGNASEAYRRSYDVKKAKGATVNRSAKALLDDPKIAARITQLQAGLQERHEITVDSQVSKLEAIYRCHWTSSFSAGAAVNAVMGQAKLAGLIVDKTKVDAKVDGRLAIANLPPLTPEAARAIMERIEAERF